MRRLAIVCTVIVSVLLAWRAGTSGAGPSDIVLFDAPRGGWLGSIRADAVTTVLEVREGWRHVRVEGWVMGASSTPGRTTGTADSPAEPAPGEAVVRGVLLSAGEAAAGTGLVVLLLDDLKTLDQEHARAGAECRTTVQEAQERLDRLNAELNRALNSSDNFRDAASRNDRLKLQIRDAERSRQERIAACREKANEIFYRHVVQKTISDPGGRFEFSAVQPGRYRVVAAEKGGDAPRSWSLECTVAGPGATTLDPSTDRSPIDPYWSLR